MKLEISRTIIPHFSHFLRISRIVAENGISKFPERYTGFLTEYSFSSILYIIHAVVDFPSVQVTDIILKSFGKN
jgi:hypothetical protein